MYSVLPKIIERKVLHKGDWLILNEATFKHKEKTGKIEYVTRPERLRNPNGSMIIPIMKKGGEKFLVMIANYRPAIEGFALEFPGGFADEGESLQDCVQR